MTRIQMIIILVTGFILLLLTGCGHNYRPSDEQLSLPIVWSCQHGDQSASGSIEGNFSGRLTVLWEQKNSGKPSGPLGIFHGALVYPSTKKRIEFYDVHNGDNLGRLKTKSSVETALAVTDSLAFYAAAPPRSHLICRNLRSGKVIWRRRLKDVVVGSIIVKDRLLVAFASGRLEALSLIDGDSIWIYQCGERLAAPPSFGHGAVIQPGENGTLWAIAIEDGSELFQTTLDAPLMGTAAVGDFIVVADMAGTVYAVDPSSGTVLWRKNLGGPIWSGPALAERRAIVGLSSGEVAALEVATGTVQWRVTTVDVVRAAPIVVGRHVVVGTMTGKLLLLDVSNGNMIEQRELKGAVRVAPVSDGERVFVATVAGIVTCFGENHDKPADRN